MRPLCPLCKKRIVAISDHKNEKTYYRKTCDACRKRKKGIIPHQPLWSRLGYHKKKVCEICGFNSIYPEEQITVFHIDGNLQNCNYTNLKSVCLNCRVELQYRSIKWKESNITPDF